MPSYMDKDGCFCVRNFNGKEIKMEDDKLMTECDQCLRKIDNTTSCIMCGKTLCPGCVCEDCDHDEK